MLEWVLFIICNYFYEIPVLGRWRAVSTDVTARVLIVPVERV